MTPRELVAPEVMSGRWGYKTVHSFMQAVKRRGIPKVYIGRSVRFDPVECDRWLAAQNPRPGRPMPRRARAQQSVTPSFVQHGVQPTGDLSRMPREPHPEIRAVSGDEVRA